MSQPATTQTEQPAIAQELVQPFADVFVSPLGVLLLGVAGLWLWSSLAQMRSKKGTLARGTLAQGKHRTAARKKAVKLMAARKHNEVALYIGTPRGATFHRTGKKWRIYLPEDPKTLYIPGAEAHIAVVGATGCGKSFSAINPMVRSAIDQGFPILYFDLKYTADNPNPSSGFMGYARDRGYQTNVFAPGLPESCRCNPLDLLRDEYDAEMARQFAVVLQKNFSPANAQSNPFFDQNAQKMIQGVMMLAKMAAYPDLMTSRAIARMPNLVESLLHSNLPEVIKAVFDPLISSAGAPETISGIQATVANLLGNLMTPNLLSALVGETTMPLDLDGRQFLSFGVDGQRRDVVLPMIATILHLLVNRNIQRSRKTPLVLVLDEIPAIYLPALADWLNQARSAGLGVILGFQSFALLEKLYGKVGAEELVTGCTTQMIFQLNDKTTAANYSELIGREDVRYHQRSRSRGKGSSGSSRSQQLQTRVILEPNQITTFPQGKCIVFNRGFQDARAVRVPYVAQIQIPQHDLDAVEASQAQWPEIRQGMIERAQFKLPSNEDFLVRNQAATDLLGDATENSASGAVTKEEIANLEAELELDEMEEADIDETQLLLQMKQRQLKPF
ncbi:type IV secretory system conjugative DNA transfer family protein [Lyngbya confervoides]|uniref:Type IV secretion system DNA-binding domain-containing protein n=1 Tax=Lyngbya confervoides BDU141951 TaxID=1574623 RepID=A0ABD4T9Z6_9CYAN|nr:TraM recognition domain-containing protein [Lyngbya confervoides]MCM1985092.1 type IV secretion system DNA-binding domain-containing protein [Lyngbya confervoides BDU141951]